MQLDRYVYAASDPIMQSDPSGLNAEDEYGQLLTQDVSIGEAELPELGEFSRFALNLFAVVVENVTGVALTPAEYAWVAWGLAALEEFQADLATARALGNAFSYFERFAQSFFQSGTGGPGGPGSPGGSSGSGGGSGGSGGRTGAKRLVPGVVTIYLYRSRWPQSSAHVVWAQTTGGKPKILTLMRVGQRQRRYSCTSKTTPSFVLDPAGQPDEYPPAVSKEGGYPNCDVWDISASDNQGAGASMGDQLDAYADSQRFTIIVRP
jgi:hypothetical protein